MFIDESYVLMFTLFVGWKVRGFLIPSILRSRTTLAGWVGSDRVTVIVLPEFEQGCELYAVEEMLGF